MAEPGSVRPSLGSMQAAPRQPPCWAPGLIQLREHTAYRPAQHSRRWGQTSSCFSAAWPGWGPKKAGSTRENPGSWGWTPGRCIGWRGQTGLPQSDQGSSSAADNPSPHPPVAVTKAPVQPLNIVVQQPPLCPHFSGNSDTSYAQPHVANMRPQPSQGFDFLSPY